MAHVNFRARPLDIERKLPVVHEEIEDEWGWRASRNVPEMGTGMEREEEKEVHIKKIVEGGPATEVDVPTPDFKEIPNYEASIPGKFKRSDAYIKYNVWDEEYAKRNGKAQYDLEEEDAAWISTINKPKRIVTTEHFEHMIDQLEFAQFAVVEKDKLISVAEAEKLGTTIGINRTASALIHDYWLQKREKLKRPLLVEYKPAPAADDPSPFVAFRPRDHERNDYMKRSPEEWLEELQNLRTHLETARILLEQVKKRERLKKSIAMIMKECGDYRRIFYSKMGLVRYYLEGEKEDDFNENSLSQMEEYTYNRIRPSKPLEKRKKTGHSFPNNAVVDKPKIPDLAPPSPLPEVGPHHYAYLDNVLEQNPEKEVPDDVPWFDPNPEHVHNHRFDRIPGVKYWVPVKIHGKDTMIGRPRLGRGGRVIIDRYYTKSQQHYPNRKDFLENSRDNNMSNNMMNIQNNNQYYFSNHDARIVDDEMDTMDDNIHTQSTAQQKPPFSFSFNSNINNNNNNNNHHHHHHHINSTGTTNTNTNTNTNSNNNSNNSNNNNVSNNNLHNVNSTRDQTGGIIDPSTNPPQSPFVYGSTAAAASTPFPQYGSAQFQYSPFTTPTVSPFSSIYSTSPNFGTPFSPFTSNTGNNTTPLAGSTGLKITIPRKSAQGIGLSSEGIEKHM